MHWEGDASLVPKAGDIDALRRRNKAHYYLVMHYGTGGEVS